MTPVIMSWSGGKDSAMALAALQRSADYKVTGLLTTVTADDGRIGMHRVRGELLARQAAALGLPLDVVEVSPVASNVAYEEAMAVAFARYRDRDIHHLAFGDLFLSDIRTYRESLVARHGMMPLFPLWNRDTTRLIAEFSQDGFRAVVVCVDLEVLDVSFAGREINDNFVADLPNSIDPCGENGEFHTFVFDGPIFAVPIGFKRGEITAQGRFCYCDLLEADGSEPLC